MVRGEVLGIFQRAEDLPATLVAQERQFAVESLNSSSSSSKKSSSSSNSSKKSTSIGSSKKVMSEALQQKIIEGKMNSWLRQTVLLKQVQFHLVIRRMLH